MSTAMVEALPSFRCTEGILFRGLWKECLSSPSGTSQPCSQRLATLWTEAGGSDHSRTGRLSTPGQRNEQTCVSQSTTTPRRVVSPICIKNPYLAENEELINRRRSIRVGRFPALTGENCMSRYRADFHQLEEIGRGNFSRVFRALKRIDGCCYAVKCTVRKLNRNRKRKQALMEVQALAALGSHKNLVGYYTAWFETDHLYIQLELCDHSLADPCVVFTSEREFIEALHQITQALEFIHERGVAHLDVKPENIYLRNGTYKLGDFGRATLLNGTLHIEEGDARYMPQEILNDDFDHLDKTDIYSLGATILDLVSSKIPGLEFQMIRDVDKIDLPGYSQDFHKLLKKLLAKDPVARPSAKELLKNPIFRKAKE